MTDDLEIGTALDPLVLACTNEAPGLEHSWTAANTCLWCGATRCPAVADHEQCLDPTRHHSDHRNDYGRRWVEPTETADVDAP